MPDPRDQTFRDPALAAEWYRDKMRRLTQGIDEYGRSMIPSREEVDAQAAARRAGPYGYGGYGYGDLAADAGGALSNLATPGRGGASDPRDAGAGPLPVGMQSSATYNQAADRGPGLTQFPDPSPAPAYDDMGSYGAPRGAPVGGMTSMGPGGDRLEPTAAPMPLGTSSQMTSLGPGGPRDDWPSAAPNALSAGPRSFSPTAPSPSAPSPSPTPAMGGDGPMIDPITGKPFRSVEDVYTQDLWPEIQKMLAQGGGQEMSGAMAHHDLSGLPTGGPTIPPASAALSSTAAAKLRQRLG